MPAKAAPEAAIKRQTVTSAVADVLRRRIISGEFPGGHQIRQEAVAAELGVSRIPVREALVQLESEGLVVIHTHRGAVVSALDIEDALDIFDTRILLEPFIIRRAIARAGDADIDNVRAALAQYERAVRQRADPAELSRLNWSLHIAMLQPAGRPRTLAVLQSLYGMADRYMRRQIVGKAAQSRAMDDHTALVEAFVRRDAAGAAGLLERHIERARDEVVAALSQ